MTLLLGGMQVGTMGHSHSLKAIFFRVFHSNTIHFIMPAGKLMQSSTSCTSMVIVWGCFKGCWAWEMLYRSYSYCETAVFFNGVPTFNFSSSMNKLEVLSAAKARHLLLVLVYRERSAIYTLYKPWSSKLSVISQDISLTTKGDSHWKPLALI